MRAWTAGESRPEITTGSTPSSRAHWSARPSRTKKWRTSPAVVWPMTPSVSVPSTSTNRMRIGPRTGDQLRVLGMRLLGHGLVHAQRLVQERLGVGERQLGGAVGERLRGLGVGLEEQPVHPARDRGAHEGEGEAPVARGFLAAGALEA